MDNNVLSCDYGIHQLEKITKIGCYVDFNQGLDARLVTDETAKILSKIKWIQYIRFSCDSPTMVLSVSSAVRHLEKHGLNRSKIFCYVLLSEDIEECLNRINFCKIIKINPFAQPYRDFTPNQIIPKWQKDMSRWCNDKAIFKSCDFEDYRPRNGFYCREYLKNIL